MDPNASKQSLLYVSDGTENVYVYTYPQGRLVGTLTGFISALGECVDSAGDVFIVTLANKYGSSSVIYEYAHAGTQPVATLNDPAGGDGCAIDPTSGNLAVANGADVNNPYGHYGDVAVYTNAQGNPAMYYSSEFIAFALCGYDTKGNLYLSATNGQYGDQDQFVRLPAGGSSFEQISLDVTLYTLYGFQGLVQRDGRYMAVASDSPAAGGGPVSVYRLRISGNNATAVATTTLSSKRNRYKTGELWIQVNRVLGSDYSSKGKGGVDSWSYPNAVKPRTVVPNVIHAWLVGLAVSPSVPR